MSGFLKQLKRLARDERGNMSLLFGMSLIPIVAAGGTAIDYSRASNARAKIQSALDSGVLAAARDVNILTDDAIKNQVKVFLDTIPSSQFSKAPVVKVLPANANIVSVEAEACIKMMFGNIIPVAEPCMVARSDSQRANKTYLEIALVLDNSGSMAGAKLDAAKTAATDFTHSLFAQNPSDTQQIKMSVVPFTLTVNAGSEMNTATDPNIDRFGQSSIHWENLLAAGATPPAGVTSRLSLYQQLDEKWGGCFEVRPGNWGLNDAAPMNSTGDSLFVPMFAPDEPGERGENAVRQTTMNDRGSGSNFSIVNSYLNDDGSQSLTYSSNQETGSTQPACSAPVSANFALPNASPTANWQSLNFLHRQSSNICKYDLKGSPGSVSDRKSILSSANNNGANRGPNFMCTARPLQKLTADKQKVLNKIFEMTADGNTNILEGLMWGWRTVSPNAPYADGRAYNWDGGPNLIRNRKYVILMTDGDNYWANSSNPNRSIYSPFGYYRNNRISNTINTAGEATQAMNTKTLQACNNAKMPKDRDNNEAIKIITIGFSTPGQQISADGLKLLQDCASNDDNGKKLFFTATNAAQLNEVFRGLAASISSIKLTN